jgi:hypothetical protein
MALIQGGELRLPEQKKGHDKVTPGGNVVTDSAKPLSYLWPMGSIPLSVSPSQVRTRE